MGDLAKRRFRRRYHASPPKFCRASALSHCSRPALSFEPAVARPQLRARRCLDVTATAGARYLDATSRTLRRACRGSLEGWCSARSRAAPAPSFPQLPVAQAGSLAPASGLDALTRRSAGTRASSAEVVEAHAQVAVPGSSRPPPELGHLGQRRGRPRLPSETSQLAMTVADALEC